VEVVLHQEQRQVISQRIDPKLIMANAILQQTSLELAQHIEAELMENPALDVIEEETACAGDCVDPLNCPFCSQRIAQKIHDSRTSDLLDMEPEFFSESSFDPNDEYDPVGNLEAEVTLQDHLRGLLRTAVSESDYVIGDYLISCLDDNGWLDADPDEVAVELGAPLTDVCRVLRVIQSFDPPGVGARDLRECMLLQLQFLREDGQGNLLAERMIRTHFDDVVNRRYNRLSRAMGIPVEKTKQTIEFVRTRLNPYPASQFRPPWAFKPSNGRSEIRPDVVIRRTEVGYEVDVVGGESLALGVNPTYREAYNTIKSGNGNVPDEDRQHVTEYVERAELFIRNINQRRKTLRLITRCIVDLQQGFLETGSRKYLLPLTRTKVAEMLGMHESTVSRATAKKYVQLPSQEVVPFDIFFNPSLAVKTAIEEIISTEDPANPLSDRQIMEILHARGIEVARRTVVKYRDSQKLLSSNRRRR
jgi:RNA polymerase sigma-54 factor